MTRNSLGHRVWTPEDDALLRAGWASGRPVREIAAEIGISKNAAMGRAHRLKLEGRPSPIKRGPIKRTRAAPVSRNSAAAASRALQQQASPLRLSPAKSVPRNPDDAGTLGVSSLNFPTRPSIPPLGGVGVLFGEARSTQCAFPLWGREKPHALRALYVCGQATARRTDGTLSPYCAGHHAVCTVRPRLAPEALAAGAA
jgi:hypothetical protein